MAAGARAKRQQVLAPLQMTCEAHPVAKWKTRHHLAALAIKYGAPASRRPTRKFKLDLGFTTNAIWLAVRNPVLFTHVGMGREVCKSLVGKHHHNRHRRRRNGGKCNRYPDRGNWEQLYKTGFYQILLCSLQVTTHNHCCIRFEVTKRKTWRFHSYDDTIYDIW
jgi:hypothetical protein